MKIKIIALLLCLLGLAHANESYTYEMFARSIENLSTAPDYLLISIKEKDGSERRCCVESSDLICALTADRKTSYKTAITQSKENWDKPFILKKSLNMTSSETDYREAKSLLSKWSDVDLKNEIKINLLIRKQAPKAPWIFQLGVARYLLENGISCTRDCEAGTLIIRSKK